MEVSSQTFSVMLQDQFSHPMQLEDLTSWIAIGGELNRSTGSSAEIVLHSMGEKARLIVHHAGLIAERTIYTETSSDSSSDN